MLRRRTNRLWGRRGISVWRASIRVKALLASCQLRLEAWSEYVKVRAAPDGPGAEEEPVPGFQTPEGGTQGRQRPARLPRNEGTPLAGEAATDPKDGTPD